MSTDSFSTRCILLYPADGIAKQRRLGACLHACKDKFYIYTLCSRIIRFKGKRLVRERRTGSQLVFVRGFNRVAIERRIVESWKSRKFIVNLVWRKKV